MDAKALFHALSKGRSNNPLFNDCGALFATAREAGLAWGVQWVPTGDNVSDLPSRPELLPTGVTHPELVVPGLPALVPAGWLSPLLSHFLLTGTASLGAVCEHAASGMPLRALTWPSAGPREWGGGGMFCRASDRAWWVTGRAPSAVSRAVAGAEAGPPRANVTGGTLPHEVWPGQVKGRRGPRAESAAQPCNVSPKRSAKS